MNKQEKFKQADFILTTLYDKSGELDLDAKQKLYAEYLKIIRVLAYANFPDAQYALAQYYEDIGYRGVPNPYHSVARKFYWYTKAANNNQADACNNLANMYENGVGCKKDLNKALELYKKSGELLNPYGKRNYKLFLKQLGLSKVKK